MTQQQENNKIISIFMGNEVPFKYTKINGSSITTYIHPSKIVGKDWSNVKLYYHKSWDALMPVCKRLSEISKYEPVSFTKDILSFDIEEVCESVVNYLKWYNKNVQSSIINQQQ